MISQKPKRVFVGIKVSKEMALLCVKFQKNIVSLNTPTPIKIISLSDLHLTLVPPFNTFNETVEKEKLQRVLKNIKVFNIKFVCVKHPSRLKLVLIEAEKSKELENLRENLLKVFKNNDYKPFTPHVTILRIKKERDKIMSPQLVDFSMLVKSIKLYESHNQGGVNYKILASINLVPDN